MLGPSCLMRFRSLRLNRGLGFGGEACGRRGVTSGGGRQQAEDLSRRTTAGWRRRRSSKSVRDASGGGSVARRRSSPARRRPPLCASPPWLRALGRRLADDARGGSRVAECRRWRAQTAPGCWRRGDRRPCWMPSRLPVLLTILELSRSNETCAPGECASERHLRGCGLGCHSPRRLCCSHGCSRCRRL